MTWQHQVTFSQPFAEVPEITISSNRAEYLTVKATQITKGSFVALVTITAPYLNDGYTINWTATGIITKNRIEDALNNIVTSQHGTFSTGTLNKSQTSEFMVNFTEPFGKIPDVILSTNNSYIKPTLKETTKGGCTVSCYNSYGSGSSAVISWNATADMA